MRAVSELRNFKSSGFDGISKEMLRKAGEENVEVLHNSF